MKRLTGLEPNEVSLVARGANRKKFMIFKSADEGKTMPKNITEIQNMIKAVPAETMNKIEKILKAMQEDSDKIGKDGEPQGGGLSDRGQAGLKAVARILAPFKDEITGDHVSAIMQELGMNPGKTGEEGNHQAGEIQLAMECPDGVKPEDHEAAMNESKKSYMGHMEKMGYQKYPEKQPEEGGQKTVGKDGEDDGEDEEDEEVELKKNKGGHVDKSAVNKSLDLTAFPEKQRGQLELIFKSNQELATQNKELVQKADKLEKQLADRDSREEKREIIAKAETFTHVALAKEEIIETLTDAKKVSEKSYERVCKQFETLNKQGKESSLFGEIGSRQSNGGGASDSQAKLDKLVDSVVMKADGSRTREQIYEAVCQTPEGKKLVNETIRESMGGR